MSMSPADGALQHDPSLLADEAVALAERWLTAALDAETRTERRTIQRLHRMIDDPSGLAFAMQFVDRVVRPEENRAAASQLRELGAEDGSASFLSGLDRALMRAGAVLAERLPDIVMPLARRRMRQLVGHLVLDADSRGLAKHLERRRSEGFRLNVNLLGEAVLGEREAERRMRSTIDLLANPHVDYVSVKISAIAPQLNPWAWDDSLRRIGDRLRTVLRAGDRSGTFVNLDMEEYHDLHLTLTAFRGVLDEPEFLTTQAGIVLQAYLPDSFDALQQLTSWANERAERGGGSIKVRIVKGANLAMERVDAAMHGWEQAPYDTKQETDANFKRCLDWLLHPQRTAAVRVGVASHNLFDLAWAHLLAAARGVAAHVEIEMLEGMAPAQARVLRDEVGTVLLYTPVVRPTDFDVAIAYLFRRLEENAARGNFLRVLGELEPGSPAFAEQARHFRETLALRWTASTAPRRRHDRPDVPSEFENEPESDPSVDETRQWALAAVEHPHAAPASPILERIAEIDAALERTRAAQRAWWHLPPVERRRTLRAVADELADSRGRLLQAMVHEGRKTIAQADPEICEAIDFCRYYAERAMELTDENASFDPHGVVAVVPPWNFPVAIPTGGMMAALAAGNGVVAKPAPEVPRCAELVVEAAHRAGVPTDLLQVLRAPETELGQKLITDADAVILTGGTDTARLFRGWQPDLRLFAETSGKNALVITPNADLDLAVRDLVASAFGHAGQKCSAASLAICVGSVYDSERFRRQLVDAVQSLAVGRSTDVTTVVGPLIGPPNERLARGFEELDAGEAWLVEPRLLDPDQHVWSPGVRIGVGPNSWFHRTECFGPVLGLMRAEDLDEAIAIQNASDFGLTGGIHTLDPHEIDHWLARVEVGNAYVNRVITGAIVRRQPFGGWKASSVGPGAKAGGPNYVAQLGTWRPTSALERGTWEASDAHWWQAEYGASHDPSALFCESNRFRYRPLRRVAVRADATGTALERVRHAARRCGVSIVESLADDESEAAFAARLPTLGVDRVRVLGPVGDELRRCAAERNIHLADDPVTNSGKLELRHYLREQSVSRTLHRFGNLVGQR